MSGLIYLTLYSYVSRCQILNLTVLLWSISELETGHLFWFLNSDSLEVVTETHNEFYVYHLEIASLDINSFFVLQLYRTFVHTRFALRVCTAAGNLG
jgi:hypothetical protein